MISDTCFIFRRYAFLVISFAILLITFTSTANEHENINDLSLLELLNVNINQNSGQIFFDLDLPPTSESVNIGLIVPFSIYRKYSVELIAAAKLAVDEINAKGGIAGKKLVVIRGDNAKNSDVTLSLARQMIDNYQVKAIIAPGSSSLTERLAKEVTIQANIPLFASSANANSLTTLDDNDLFFRVIATNRDISERILLFLETQKLTKIGTFFSRDIFGKELVEGLINSLQQIDAALVYQQSLSNLVNYESFDLSVHIRNAQNSGAEILILPLESRLSRHFFNQLVKHWRGKLPILLFPDHQSSEPDPKLNKSKQNICVYTIIPTLNMEDSAVVKGLYDMLSIKRSSFTATFIHDIVYLMARSLNFVNQKDVSFPEALRSITAEGKPMFNTDSYKNISELIESNALMSFSGQSGKIHFDAAGDNVHVELKVKEIHQIYGVGCLL